MKPYHKIQTVFLRDPETKHRYLLEGQFAKPEFEFLADNEWIFTEKVDGSSIRIWNTSDGFAVYGRTDNAQIPAKLTQWIEQQGFRERMRLVFGETHACLYGEGYGPGIQKGGGNYRGDQAFVLFDVFVNDIWLTRYNVHNIADALGICAVPIIGSGDINDMVQMVRSGFKSQWGDFQAEGIVARPATELRARNGDRIITKLKCKDFPG